MMNNFGIFFFAWLLLLSGPGISQSIDKFTEARIDSVMSFYSDPLKPGAAIAVVRSGEIVFKKGYGSANLEYDIPVTPSTVFHIASVSKQFTVFAVLLLQEQGKLSLDDDVRMFLPEVPDFGHRITLRHLASHTSGMRDQWNLLTMAGWRMDDVITTAHILKLVERQKELNFLPGEEYMYCNTGFTLLAEVVARVSGKSFPEFCHENIFAPLGMHSTLFYDDHERIVKNRAYSYRPVEGGFKKSVLSYANAGATSLFTTVEDLALWAMNFSNPRVGSAASFREMNTPFTLNSGEQIEGALGQFVRTHKGLKVIEHGGADAGYRSFLARFPEQDLAVIFFSNAANANTGLAKQLADLFLEDHMVEAQAAPPANEASQQTAFGLKTEELARFAGRYYSPELSTLYELVISEGKLQARHYRHSNIELTPVETDTFTGRTLSRIVFERDAEGRITGFRSTSGRVRNLLFERVGDDVMM